MPLTVAVDLSAVEQPMPRIVPRKGSVVHREVVEKVPMGWEG